MLRQLRINTQRVLSRRRQSTVPPTITNKYLLTYKYVDNIVELREPFREEHFRNGLHEVKAGRLQEAGAFADPVDGAMFVFTNCDSEGPVKKFVEKDPYYVEGLVLDYKIRKWTVAINSDEKSD